MALYVETLSTLQGPAMLLLRNIRLSNKTKGFAWYGGVGGRATEERALCYLWNLLEWCITGQTHFGAWQ